MMWHRPNQTFPMPLIQETEALDIRLHVAVNYNIINKQSTLY